jgi:hypothetical protein
MPYKYEALILFVVGKIGAVFACVSFLLQAFGYGIADRTQEDFFHFYVMVLLASIAAMIMGIGIFVFSTLVNKNEPAEDKSSRRDFKVSSMEA